MITEVLKSTDKEAIKKGAKIIREGGIVAFPTETVYGLGANAYDKDAVSKIFEAKGRPSDNPLIVHVSTPYDAENIAYTNELYYKLAKEFMPGPLTIILPKKDVIPKEVTAGLDSVAIRCPVNKVANELIREAGVPIAAPSANKSGRPSPTKASHVYDDMDGEIPLIIDGGECDVGVESTVIKISDSSITILRPGLVTYEELLKVCSDVSINEAVLNDLKPGEIAQSPGMKYKHYAPKAKLFLIDDSKIDFFDYINSKYRFEKVALMCYNEERELFGSDYILLPVGDKEDIKEQIKRLFNLLREADEKGAEYIFAHLPSKEGESLAMYNRMIRACAHRVIGEADVDCKEE